MPVVSSRAKAVRLTASNVQGHGQGLAQAQFVATLLTAEGQPIYGETVRFVTGNTRQEFGYATTDTNGRAVLESGSQVFNPEVIVSSAATGYIAIFDGTPEFKPAEAKGRISLGV